MATKRQVLYSFSFKEGELSALVDSPQNLQTGGYSPEKKAEARVQLSFTNYKTAPQELTICLTREELDELKIVLKAVQSEMG